MEYLPSDMYAASAHWFLFKDHGPLTMAKCYKDLCEGQPGENSVDVFYVKTCNSHPSISIFVVSSRSGQ